MLNAGQENFKSQNTKNKHRFVNTIARDHSKYKTREAVHWYNRSYQLLGETYCGQVFTGNEKVSNSTLEVTCRACLAKIE